MSEKITIALFNQWNFFFDINNADFYDINHLEREQCYHCGHYLDKVYSYIINCLKEANFLDKNYKEVCCQCKVLENFGLLDLNSNMSHFLYNIENDILIIEFSFPQNINDIKLGDDELLIWHRIYFSIHDYSKVKWD